MKKQKVLKKKIRKTKNSKQPEIKLKQSEIQLILKQLEKKKQIKAKKLKQKTKQESIETKTKTKKQVKNIDYKNKIRLDYQKANFYKSGATDYQKLFGHMGNVYENPYDSYKNNTQFTEKSNELTAEKLEKIIHQEQMSLMLRNSLDRPDIKDRESYKMWAQCNRLMNIIKINEQHCGNAIPGVFYF